MDVLFYVVKAFRMFLNSGARLFGQPGWAAAVNIPVIIHKMVETRFGDGAAEVISVFIVRPFERHDQIELTARGDARTSGNDTAGRILGDGSHGTFVGMSGEVFDQRSICARRNNSCTSPEERTLW